MTGSERKLPLGMWRITRGWAACVALLAIVVGLGIYAYSQQLGQGLVVTHMRTIGRGGAAWGLYITFDVVFIGVSFAGVTIAALIRLFGLEVLKPLARAAELLTIVALIAGGMVVLADLGRPLSGLLNLPRFARPSSPFFGTFTMVIGGYLFASLVYFYLAGRADAAQCARYETPFRLGYRLWASGYRGTADEQRRHEQVSFWMSLFILPLLVIAHSTLGFIFGIQHGRPGWYSALQAPGFVVMAGISGIGVLIAIAAVLRKTLRQDEAIRPEAFRLLGNMLWVLIAVYGYFMIAEELTVTYAGAAKERAYAHEVVFGAYAGIFWTVVAALAIPLAILFVQFVRGTVSIGWTVAAGLIVNIAAVLKRFLLVVASQTHGLLLEYPRGSYWPSWIELAVVAGLIAFAALLYSVFIKVFPILPLPRRAPEAAALEPRRRKMARVALTAGTFVGGLAFAVIGFLASARVGTEPRLDPIIPFSPVLFILGVMMVFYTGAVFETLPPTKAVRSGTS